MVTVVVWETWFVGATTARNLVGISIRVTTVVTTHQSQKKEASNLSYLSLCHLQLIRDARGVTMMVGVGAAPLKNHVVRKRVTVMDMVMGGRMTVIEDAKVTWYVVETTARNTDHGTMRRMTVVRGQATKDGVHGRPGHHVTITVDSRAESDIVMGTSALVHNGIKTDLARFGDTLAYSVPLPLLVLYFIFT